MYPPNTTQSKGVMKVLNAFRPAARPGQHRDQSRKLGKVALATVGALTLATVVIGAGTASAGLAPGSRPGPGPTVAFSDGSVHHMGSWFVPGTNTQTDCIDAERTQPTGGTSYSTSTATASKLAYVEYIYGQTHDSVTDAARAYYAHHSTEISHKDRVPWFFNDFADPSKHVPNVAAIQAKINAITADANAHAGKLTIKLTVTNPTDSSSQGTVKVEVRNTAGADQAGYTVKLSGAAGMSSSITSKTTPVSLTFTATNSQKGTISASASNLPPTTIKTYTPADSSFQRVVTSGTTLSAAASAAYSRPALPNGGAYAYKVNKSTGAAVSAPASIAIRDTAASGKLLAILKTGANGKSSNFTTVPGKNYWAGESTPPTGFAKDAPAITWTAVSGQAKELKYADTPLAAPTSKVVLNKVDPDNQPLPGAKVGFYVATKLYASGLSNAAGKWLSPALALPPGTKGTIQELAAPAPNDTAPAGYRKFAPIAVTTTADGSGAGTVTGVDQLATVTLSSTLTTGAGIAPAAAGSSTRLVPAAGGPVTDVYHYTAGLVAGQKYTLVANLRPRVDGALQDGPLATQQIPFTPATAAAGDTPGAAFQVPALTGATNGAIWVGTGSIYLGDYTAGDTPIDDAIDPTDPSETVYQMGVSTTVVNQSSGLGQVIVPGTGTGNVVVDSTQVCSAAPGQPIYITATGTGKDLATGAVTPITVTGSSTVTPADSGCHVYPVTYKITGTVNPNSTVSFHEVTYVVPAGSPTTWTPGPGDKRSTENTTDVPSETVYVPSAATNFRNQADGTQFFKAGDTGVDAVDYSNLPTLPDTKVTATATASCLNTTTGQLTPIPGATGVTVFTPTGPNGSVNVTVTLPAGMAPCTVSVDEKLTINGVLVAEHNSNGKDEHQQGYMWSISTVWTNKADGGKFIEFGQTGNDTLTVTGQPGAKVTAIGTARCLNGDGTLSPIPGAVGTGAFTIPASGTGVFKVDITLPDQKGTPCTTTIYEQLMVNGKQVADHNKSGTVVTQQGKMRPPVLPTIPTPSLKTTLYGPNNTRGTVIDSTSTQLGDQVKCFDTVIGVDYYVKGNLRTPNGTPSGNATGITGKSTDFVGNGTMICAIVPFTLTGTLVTPGKSVKVVAFEYLIEVKSGQQVASHEDITDNNQALTVEHPATGKVGGVVVGGNVGGNVNTALGPDNTSHTTDIRNGVIGLGVAAALLTLTVLWMRRRRITTVNGPAE